MKSPIVKRSIARDKTSVSLEDAFWEGLKDIAKTKRKTLSDLVSGIDTDRVIFGKNVIQKSCGDERRSYQEPA
jgi:predicted DNA-binding ribbon-helix-helix protein